MKKNIKKILLVLVVLGLVAAGGGWYIIQKKLEPKDDYLKYCDQAHRIYEQMVEFEKDYMDIPSADAMEGDDQMVGLNLQTSNGYLAQLIIGAGMNSEDIFFLKGAACCSGIAPDNKVAPAKEALRAGENGWAYFKGRELSKENPQPLLVPGYNPKTKKWDAAIWKHGVPVLFTDGSVVLYQAESDGEEGGYKTTTEPLPFKVDDPNLVMPAMPKG